MNFGAHLVPDTRLTRRVGQQSRIEKRDQRRRDGFRPPVGKPADDAAKQFTGFNRSFGGEAGGVWHLPNHVDQAAREINADRRSFPLVDRCNGLANDTRQMKPDAIGGFAVELLDVLASDPAAGSQRGPRPVPERGRGDGFPMKRLTLFQASSRSARSGQMDQKSI